MTVETHIASDVFIDLDFSELESMINNIKSDNHKIFPEERGALKDNIYEDCKFHNMAVNAKFSSVQRNRSLGSMVDLCREALKKYQPDCGLELRNSLWYQKDEYMGWHTNKYSEGFRYYLIWAEEENKSFFDYYEDGELKTITAPKGWSVNSFYCGGVGNELAHQVRSETNRLSLGFRLR